MHRDLRTSMSSDQFNSFSTHSLF
uniref:Uncharacterized protein n=1 Tax=Arundo donax TaxID=35708 RepID=A0A0A8Z9Z3_ARUDO